MICTRLCVRTILFVRGQYRELGNRELGGVQHDYDLTLLEETRSFLMTATQTLY
jgi:hypothetical protein